MDSNRNQDRCKCIFPGPGEQELATLPGESAGSSLRVSVQPGPDGYVRLEQLAFDDSLGWYVQKSFCVPGDMLRTLIPHLRQADCLIPRPAADGNRLRLPAPHLRLSTDAAPEAERREA